VSLGLEAGFASGDSAPGFGNSPGTLDSTSGSPALPGYGSVEGPQYGVFDGRTDRSITNFRFNPGYRVDMILWRELLGNVTDAWYAKPSLRWDVVGGLVFDASLIYSQAVTAASTPSATRLNNGVAPLGIEFDTKLTYGTDDGFHGWLQYGLLQPLDGFSGAGSLTRAHALRAGLAIKF